MSIRNRTRFRLTGVLSVAALMITAVLMAGCNTVEGAGRDVEATGEGLQRAVD